ncbi:hypothetical protein MBLNU457_g0831t1 [Dothideomycetes sp. NU457]
MRLLPNPWYGLHPAWPDQPPPLSASNFTAAPGIGANVGLYGVAVGAFFKGRPTLGLTAAAYTMALAGCGYAYLNYAEGVTARRFLETKGINVPKRKFVDRLGSFDQDNVLLLGVLVGIAVAARRIRPEHMSRFSWYGGAACFGTLGSQMALKLVPWPARREAQDQVMKNGVIAQQYHGEIIATMRPNSWPWMREEIDTADSPAASPASARGGRETDRPAESLPLLIARVLVDPSSVGGEDSNELLERLQAEKLDYDDPRPHLSEFEDGERVFKPQTNYEWMPRSDEEARLRLNEHIEYLKKRREGISKEAELFWHTVAIKEAEYYKTKDDTPLKKEQRAALGIMNQVHLDIWLQASVLDWMIADSTKNLLQVEAMSGNDKGIWLPPLPKTAEKIKPKLTGKLLAELSDANRDDYARLKELETPVGVHRDEKLELAAEAVKEMLTALENRQKALDALLDDNDRRNRNS